MVHHSLWKLRWERIGENRRSFRAEEREWGIELQINFGEVNE